MKYTRFSRDTYTVYLPHMYAVVVKKVNDHAYFDSSRVTRTRKRTGEILGVYSIKFNCALYAFCVLHRAKRAWFTREGIPVTRHIFRFRVSRLSFVSTYRNYSIESNRRDRFYGMWFLTT